MTSEEIQREGMHMSRIYSNLLQVEMEKQGWVNDEPAPKVSEEKVVSLESVVGPRSLEEKKEPPATELKEKDPHIGPSGHPLPALFSNLATHLKNSFGSIRNLTEFSQGRFKDSEFGYYFQRMIVEDVDKAEAELNCFLDFLRMKSSAPRANTVHLVLEDLLKRNERKLREKKIRIVKKQYEKDLPETTVQDEELKYILNWIIQYAITSAASSGTIGILTRSSNPHEIRDDIKSTLPRDKRYLEILVAFGGNVNNKANDHPLAVLGLQTLHRESGNSLILPLVEEVVQKNRGALKSKVDHEKGLTQISLILPCERRKVVQYQPRPA
jgi:nitrogen-specific signal transduction histidine kinase